MAIDTARWPAVIAPPSADHAEECIAAADNAYAEAVAQAALYPSNPEKRQYWLRLAEVFRAARDMADQGSSGAPTPPPLAHPYECPECQGVGEVVDRLCSHDGSACPCITSDERTCEACQGAGILSSEDCTCPGDGCVYEGAAHG